MTWTQCTESAGGKTEQVGLDAFGQPCLVAEMKQDLPNMKLFSLAHGVNKGVQGFELFIIFLEAKGMLSAWARRNLKTLNSGVHEVCPLEET